MVVSAVVLCPVSCAAPLVTAFAQRLTAVPFTLAQLNRRCVIPGLQGRAAHCEYHRLDPPAPRRANRDSPHGRTYLGKAVPADGRRH